MASVLQDWVMHAKMNEPTIYVMTFYRKRWRWWPLGFRLEYRDKIANATTSRENAEAFARDCVKTLEMQEAGTFVYKIAEPIYDDAPMA